MKPLDEVIKAMSICKNEDTDRTCEGCPMPDTEMCINELMTDALHYLEEYRETKKHLACLDHHEIRGDNTQVVNNPPLTWDELKTMEGKPVWIEADNGQEQFKHWFIIDEFTFSDIPGLQIMWCLNNSFRFWEADIGKTWQAYRKERK